MMKQVIFYLGKGILLIGNICFLKSGLKIVVLNIVMFIFIFIFIFLFLRKTIKYCMIKQVIFNLGKGVLLISNICFLKNGLKIVVLNIQLLKYLSYVLLLINIFYNE